jgi:hypothetical protein
MQTQNKFFCVLPFFGQEAGIAPDSPCCLLPQDEDIPKLKQTMLNNQIPKGCFHCSIPEANGHKSDRQIKNATLDYLWDKDLVEIEKIAIRGENKVNYVKLYTSNICNGACVTCGGHLSTGWRKYEKTIGTEHATNVTPHEEIDKLIHKDLVFLSILGGEPFYDKLTVYTLQKLVDCGNTQCHIDIITNTSTIPTKEQMDLLLQFPKLTLTCSIDAIGDMFEYMRFPLKWSNTLDTIGIFKTMPNAILNANIVVSKLNILHLKETEDWLKEQGFTISYSYIQDTLPYWESHIFTENQKKKVLEANDYNDHVRTLLYKEKLKPELIKQGQIKLDWQDAVKGIKLKDKMPEVYKLFTHG